MKKILIIVICFCSLQVDAQYFKLTYFLNGCAGNPLNGATGIYLYAGAGTASPTSTYDYTAGTFSGDSLGLHYIGNNSWEICFDPYQIFYSTINGAPMPGGTTIYNFEINFRDSAGNIFTGQCASGSYIKIDNPMTSPQTLFPNIVNGQPVTTCVVGLPEYNFNSAISVSPNPMQFDGAQFEINLSHEQVVSLQLFNMLGKKVRTLVDHQKLSGSNKFHFNARDDQGKQLTGGCYFYSLEAGNKKLKSGRLIILN